MHKPTYPASGQELQHLASLLRIEEEEERRLYREKVVLQPLDKRIKDGVTWFPALLSAQGYGTGDTLRIQLEATGGAPGPDIFSGGQIVSVFPEPAFPDETPPAVHGVVAKVQARSLVVVLSTDNPPDWLWGSRLGVDHSYDDRSYREMERALETLRTTGEEQLVDLRERLLGHRPVRFHDDVQLAETALAHLNSSQQAAVHKALAAKDGFFILGPPGTGKTTTLVAAIKQAVQTERQVLVCAPSNTAVDLLAERLHDAHLRVVRVGHPARVSDTLQQLTLDHQLTEHYDYNELKRLKQRADNLLQRAGRMNARHAHEKRKRYDLQKEARYLRRDADKLEQFMLQQVLQQAQVIVTTLTGAASQWVNRRSFKTVFIDEACQALEPACWIAIKLARRVIFAGDPFQLPPTVKSIQAAREGLALSLAEKFYQRHPHPDEPAASAMLTVQYRMHRQIMQFSSTQFYDGQLQADASVAEGTLHPQLPPVQFIDTAGAGFEEIQNPETLSRGNPAEVELVYRLAEHVVATLRPALDAPDAQPLSLGVIAPYQEQVRRLRIRLEAAATFRHHNVQLQVRTVDGFQGQERDVILISLVRSNNRGEIGFLQETRRMNVALTRAKKLLIIVGDSATVAQHPFYDQLIHYIQTQGDYRHLYSLAPEMQPQLG